MAGRDLAQAVGGVIRVDADAAGWGWATGSQARPARMHLASVLVHELGHTIGLMHGDAAVMRPVLFPGATFSDDLGSGGRLATVEAAPASPVTSTSTTVLPVLTVPRAVLGASVAVLRSAAPRLVPIVVLDGPDALATLSEELSGLDPRLWSGAGVPAATPGAPQGSPSPWGLAGLGLLLASLAIRPRRRTRLPMLCR
jgi:hypothetical protein